MKIKNILYVASFMAFAGINAAERARAVDQQQQILDEYERSRQRLHDVSEMGASREGYVWRATGAIRSSAKYIFHIAKYPAMFVGASLPFALTLKEDFLNSTRDYFNLIVGTAAVTGAAAGIYYGPRDFADAQAKENAKTDLLDAKFVAARCATKLITVQAEAAALRNIHGLLGQVQTNLTALTAGCNQAARQLHELKTASAETQNQLAIANAELTDVTKRQQEVKVLALIKTIQAVIEKTTATWERFDALQRASERGEDVQERLIVAMMAYSGITTCEQAMVLVNGFGEGVDSRYSAIVAGLRERLTPVLTGQAELRVKIEDIYEQLSLKGKQVQQAAQLRLDGQRQRALEGAAHRSIPAVRALPSAVTVPVPVVVQQQQAQNIQPPLVAQNYFGGPVRFRQPRPVTPPADTVVQITEVTKEDVD